MCDTGSWIPKQLPAVDKNTMRAVRINPNSQAVGQRANQRVDTRYNALAADSGINSLQVHHCKRHLSHCTLFPIVIWCIVIKQILIIARFKENNPVRTHIHWLNVSPPSDVTLTHTHTCTHTVLSVSAAVAGELGPLCSVWVVNQAGGSRLH